MEPVATYSGEKVATGIDEAPGTAVHLLLKMEPVAVKGVTATGIDGSGESFRRCDKVWS